MTLHGVLLGTALMTAIGTAIAIVTALLLYPLIQTPLFSRFGEAILAVFGREHTGSSRYHLAAIIGGLAVLWFPVYLIVGFLAFAGDRPQWLADLDIFILPGQWLFMTVAPILGLHVLGHPWLRRPDGSTSALREGVKWAFAMATYAVAEAAVGLAVAFAGDAIFL